MKQNYMITRLRNTKKKLRKELNNYNRSSQKLILRTNIFEKLMHKYKSKSGKLILLPPKRINLNLKWKNKFKDLKDNYKAVMLR